MKVGLYGGSFDPPHFGHLNLAFELMEKCQLDEVWFIPARVNPHKTESPPVSIEHRLEMLNLALKGIPQFQVKDLERHLPSPSYTIQTLRFLTEKEKDKQFCLLLGEDSISKFLHWHLPHEIVRLVPLLIGSRSGQQAYQGADGDEEIKHAIQKGFIQTRCMDISSTDLRERLKKKLYCGHLIPSNVLSYIQHNHLYENAF